MQMGYNLTYGGWSARLADKNGSESQNTQIKAKVPRTFTDYQTRKTSIAKYESPKDSETFTLIPYTDNREVELELIAGVISRYKKIFKTNNIGVKLSPISSSLNPTSSGSYLKDEMLILLELR